MTPFYIVFTLLLSFFLLMGGLYYLGIATTRIGCGCFIDFSFPTRWEGQIQGTSGLLHRNFVVFKKYSKLLIEIQTNSGTIDFDVRGSDGSTLSPASGTYGPDVSVLMDVSRFKRCSVALRMQRFNGKFSILL